MIPSLLYDMLILYPAKEEEIRGRLTLRPPSRPPSHGAVVDTHRIINITLSPGLH